MKRKRSPKETVTVGNVKVEIYQRTRRNEYGVRQVLEVSDYTSGLRVLRSFSNHAAARAEAEKVARQLSTGAAAAASMKPVAEAIAELVAASEAHGLSVRLARFAGAFTVNTGGETAADVQR